MTHNKVSFLDAQIWVNFNANVMSRRLLEITPQYSSFVDDQVLTSAKLNEFMEYFDEQDRLTRVCLTGVGIACGFTVDFDQTDSQITILQGCGITTDGDLIKLQKDIDISDEQKKVLGDSFKNIREMVTSITYTHSKLFIDEHVQYQPFQNDGSIINIHELVSNEDAYGDSNAIKLTHTVLANKVVVLYLECYEKKATICTTTTCDNQGLPNIQNIKVLLIDKNNVEEIVNGSDSIFNKHNIYEAILSLPRTAVQRVVLKGEGGGSNNISNYSKIAAVYKSKITNAKDVLNTAYSDFFIGFSELLEIPNNISTSILNHINNLDNFQDNKRIQYRYALTKNISDSFNEIADLLLKLKVECCPDIHAFPKHLLLGSLTSEKVYPELRHSFYHAPANNDYHTIIREVASLIKRVHYMLNNFNLNNTEEMEITPSLSCGPLGSKAIPVYFDVDDSLLKVWDFNKTENFKQQYNLSFHKTLLAPGSWVQSPLNFEVGCTDLYKIEGLFGQVPAQSKNFVDTLKAEKGLDFDCVLFDIDKDIEEFSAFVREHPSITHKGGVDKGGTYILLANSDEVVADFSISYKIAPEAGGLGCCPLIECSYPWISSLKYINNLSRSLKGEQSQIKAMPEKYVLKILAYRINNQPVITSQQTISIPLEEVYLRRMHAITEALNNRFPEGVVFDFNEDQKRLLIIRHKEDTFSIRIKETSHGIQNATYIYSNNGLFRNDKVFRPKSMICRNLNEHNKSFYRNLHREYAPFRKDDDYGTYDNKWARWFELVDNLLPELEYFGNNKRFKTSIDDFTGDLIGGTRYTLNKILKDLFEYNDEMVVAIDGDWVNGAWVDLEMLNHRKDNPKNTADSIVEFVNLRDFLHQKSIKKTTKFSIYISGVSYSSALESVIAPHYYDADFYFAKPNGVNSFTL